MARLPELQARRGHTGAVSSDRRRDRKTPVGRSVPDHRHHASGQRALAQPLGFQFRVLRGWEEV